jgi:hypothetical protein
MADDGIPITQANVDAFTEKLQRWAEDLPIEEKAVLHSLLARAEETAPEGDESEVEGFALGGFGGFGFTPKLLSKTFGAADDGTVDSWPKGGSWIKLWGQTIPR